MTPPKALRSADPESRLPTTLDLAFWAEDRASAERQAHEWAAAETAILSIDVLESVNDPGRATWWTVTVAPEWRSAGVPAVPQLRFDLA